ncbi:putative ubiquitin-conjugating enzyme E2 38 isoform X1 [Nicotiana tabacum]|uniref:E2 ubiquitin-conjugating enzyme n=2 Tax=Nicotiana tabacum TaxID=4097 RepID=A0A1S3ZZQ0_TOBAC|nr:putative ubiquitin-conjugating enzyme E2 38 isoform X1 [Nicotiana tomentosiformis]XP_016469858.1 PREDICTED: putative ubiquitin-conjugating enzyme E2 38 isoform X1 [Nicotiana tabacum]
MDVEIEQLSSQDSDKLKHNKEVMTKDNSQTVAGSTSVSLDSGNNNSSNSDLSFHEDQNNGDDGMDDGDDVSNYDNDDDDNDYMFYDNDDDDECDYLSMQAQFDNVDLPAGVEATVSWLNEPAPSSKAPSQVSSSSHLVGVGTVKPTLPENGRSSNLSQVPASSSSLVSVESSSHGKEEATEEEAMKKYQSFKHFDVVDDFSDHHYSSLGFQGQQPPKAWSKKVQDEWKILENDLPDTIYVRVYESRMDLLRAVIIGPEGTPYHDGLFVFDVLFPQNYPDVPPMVYYYSGGLRLNPNLYDCGKVCLSLLNTWTGKGNERWLPKTSTMLQVLVSIQALILNSRPFFNEPGYEASYPGPDGERRSKAYNEDVFVLSLKTMTYTLRRPPKHFEDLVIGHFRCYAVDILSACKAYVEGAPVGSVVKGKVQGNATEDRSSPIFRESVSRMMNGLISLFTKNGAKDCDRFRV